MVQPAPNAPVLYNRYEIGQTLGSGGMAVVYRAIDLTLQRAVAIKVLRQDYSNDKNFSDLFLQEARHAARLGVHPNIVTVHDFGEDAGRLFIVMEYIEGYNLKDLIRQKGRFQIEEGISLFLQACEGIGFAHRSGVIHCDVKPQNMVVTREGRLKVTDFGIARAWAQVDPEERASMVWGSPQYFSPEQASGRPPTAASDVYSLGVVLYEMLTGQLPHLADSAEELANLHRSAQPIPPARLNPHISTDLENVILRAMNKEPSQRYRTADLLGRVVAHLNPRSERYPVNASSGQRVSPSGAYAPPRPTQGADTQPSPRPAPAPQAAQPQNQGTVPPRTEPAVEPVPLDWVNVLLGLMALLLWVGLIPFAIYVLNQLFR